MCWGVLRSKIAKQTYAAEVQVKVRGAVLMNSASLLSAVY